jgi:hypothetical protein
MHSKIFILGALASAVTASPIVVARDDPLCYQKTGIQQPTAGTSIPLSQNSNGVNVTVIYCSGQYFKTRSLDLSVGLSQPGSPSGELLAKGVQPDNKDAQGGFYSYRFDVTILPNSGSGERTLNVFETATGKYNGSKHSWVGLI